MKVGIAGAGGIGLGYASWISHRGYEVTIWSPTGRSADALLHEPLSATGALEGTVQVASAGSARELALEADVIVIAVPLNGHRAVMDAVLPHLRGGQLVIVSSMASLSSLYLYERACSRGVHISVASFGTTALTARRKGLTHVEVMTQRPSVGVSCLPRSRTQDAVSICEALFGGAFVIEDSSLTSTLANTNAVAHVPLAIFNWTRIERGEKWPQYHFMTSHVAAVIEKLDAERVAVAEGFGLSVRNIEQHFSKSFRIEASRLEDMAIELHTRRGGPPGPTDVNTRFLSEDVPYGLVFMLALARMASVSTPVMDAMTTTAGLIVGENFVVANNLLDGLKLHSESVEGLLKRVCVN